MAYLGILRFFIQTLFQIQIIGGSDEIRKNINFLISLQHIGFIFRNNKVMTKFVNVCDLNVLVLISADNLFFYIFIC